MTRELSVLRHALSQGHLTPPQVREALLLADALAAPPLRLVLRAAPAGARADLVQVWSRLRRAGDPPDDPAAAAPWTDAIPPAAARRVQQQAQRPSAEDPPRVASTLDALRSVLAPDEATRDGPVSAPVPVQAPSTGSGSGPAIRRPGSSGRFAPDAHVGPCRIVRELGRGAFGTVFLAQHERLERPVAIKVIHGHDARALERFRTEARVMARLRHPNIVGVHEVGEHEGAPFIVMDYVQGEPLDARIRREGKLEPREAARLAALLARGLDAAHRQSVLHRDVKPQNVLLDERGEALLGDFGVARAIDEARALTRTGQAVGTIAYAAPEQAMGRHAEVDARSDVYGVGATLYEMLAGRPPFAGETAVNTLHQVATMPPPSLREARSDLDPALEALCLRCLAKKPADRPASAAALAEELERWLAGQTPAAPAPASPGGGALRLVVGLLLGGLAGVLAHALLAPRPEPVAPPTPPGPAAPVAALESAATLVARARALGEGPAAADALARACEVDPLEAATAPALAPILVAQAERLLGAAAGAAEAARGRRLLVAARRLAPDLELKAAVARLDALASATDPVLAAAACPWLGASLPGEAEWARRLLGTPFLAAELGAATIVDRATWPDRLSVLWRACDSWPRPEEAFDTALLFRTEAAALWWGRARLAIERGELALGARLLDVAATREDHGELHHQRARLERLRPGGSLARAIELARAAQATDVRRQQETAWPWHQLELARLLVERGGASDLAEARAILELLVEVRGFEHPTAFGILSRVHAALGEGGEPERRARERRDSLQDQRYRNHGDR